MTKEEYRKAFFAGRNYYHDLITDETKDSTISAFDKWYTNAVLLQGAVISMCQPEPKNCDCKRKDDYTAKFICDGNCK